MENGEWKGQPGQCLARECLISGQGHYICRICICRGTLRQGRGEIRRVFEKVIYLSTRQCLQIASLNHSQSSFSYWLLNVRCTIITLVV